MPENLILIAGLACNEKLWQEQERSLKNEFNVQTINTYGADTQEQLVQKVLTETPSSFHLAGHSMGGWLALALALEAPQKIKSLTLINTSALEDTEMKRASRFLLIDKAKKNYSEVISILCTNFLYQKQYERTVTAMMQEVGADRFIQQEQVLLQRKPLSLNRHIDIPTLIIHSDHDQNFTEDHAIFLNKEIRDSVLTVISQCGHLSPIEQSHEVTVHLYKWVKAHR